MAQNTTETVIGAIVLIVAAGFFFFVAQSTGINTTGAGNYALTASFRSVEGISVGTDVRLAGVKVGTVTDLRLNPLTYQAEAVFSVSDTLTLSDDTQALISSEGLLGGNFLELVPGGSPDDLAAGDEILDTQGAVSLTSLLMKFVGGSAQ